jgi:hypothetical protein
MPISGLDAYLQASRQLHTAPLTALRDTRLGIDLTLYLRLLLNSPRTAEPLVAALGGAPLALIAHIEADLRALERARIKPVFVLAGLPPLARRARPFSFAAHDARAEERRRAWSRYEAGDVDAAHRHLSRAGSVREADLIRAVLRAFRHRNVEFLIAPYGADGQVSDARGKAGAASRSRPDVAMQSGAVSLATALAGVPLLATALAGVPRRSCCTGTLALHLHL